MTLAIITVYSQSNENGNATGASKVRVLVRKHKIICMCPEELYERIQKKESTSHTNSKTMAFEFLPNRIGKGKHQTR